MRRDTRARAVMCATDAPDQPNSSTVTTAAESSRARCISDTCTRGEVAAALRADWGRLVIKLRLQARGRSARGGLAGRSRANKRGFGLALPRAGGEHHRARGLGASNNARKGVACHTPRGGSRTGCFRRLDQGCYWDKRERERERDASAMLRHLPTGVYWRTPTLLTSIPEENTRKQPLICDLEPSPKGPAQALEIDPETDPNPIYLCPVFHRGTP